MERVLVYLPSNLAHLRKINKMPQSDLANRLGIKPQTLSGWETGYRRPDLLDVARIAKIFNVSTDDLMHKDLRISDKYTKEEVKEKINTIVDKSELEENKKVTIKTMVNMICEDEK